MSKRRLFLIAGTLLVMLIVLAILLPRTGVTEANFSRIKEGMTRQEVEAILGDPSTGRGPPRKIFLPFRPELPPGGSETRWRGNDGIIIIQFDDKDIVIQRFMCGQPEPFNDKIRRWLDPTEWLDLVVN